MPARLPSLACCLALAASACLAGMPARAQEPKASAGTTVIQPENVRWEVAQVLRVKPVYQVLRATRMEPRCPEEGKDEEGRISRIAGNVRDALLARREAQQRAAAENCRMVPVEREFRRPIAYDVDYVYRGMKYRSRLPYDPGNHLRIRVSVTPYLPPAEER